MMRSSVKKKALLMSSLYVAALTTMGCGGGDEEPMGGGTNPPGQTIVVEGSARPISADPLSVVFVAHTSTHTAPAFQTIASAKFPEALQKTTAEGAYAEIGVNTGSLITLNSGKIVDVVGNDDYAIGRWTDGSTSFGTVGPNQGDHYAIGRPLFIHRVMEPRSISCALDAATRPTSVRGTYPPGDVLGASATIGVNGPVIDKFDLRVRIGNDTEVHATAIYALLNGVMQSQGFLRQTQTFGTDESKPYLAVGYVIPTPNSGDVAGLVVLKCG
ncbi:hypothetical protein [Cupriavidus pauculus]|uniref:hypothetical protein n=1 Tax=Cupriavidus pauculus TaxID=82633 RepID=UPI001EE29663|nr:hypothetical protein [Cupriavidus pauculus]GJG97747.1 hypothetical protein CBA19C6_24680 [Cupriavidus pauculus]